jgi:hypothetical protein
MFDERGLEMAGLTRRGTLQLAALAGCGGHTHVRRVEAPAPKLPRALAGRLATLSTDVARELDVGDACAASASAADLQRQTIAAINRGAVPAALQETLQSSVTDVVSRIRCVPSPAPTPAPAPKGRSQKKHDHGKDRRRTHDRGGGE